MRSHFEAKSVSAMRQVNARNGPLVTAEQTDPSL
jgi:hypothetical protein